MIFNRESGFDIGDLLRLLFGRSLLSFKTIGYSTLIFGVLYDTLVNATIKNSATHYGFPNIDVTFQGPEIATIITCAVTLIVLVVSDAVLIERENARRTHLCEIARDSNTPEDVRQAVLDELTRRNRFVSIFRRF